jgi:peptidoglycan/xylan/chitin deacetylase (PgdA/CDA1 family)
MLQYRYRADAPPTRRTREGNVQSWSDYSPIIDRPKIHWPSGAHVAVWVCPNVLSWEFTPPADPWLEAWARMPQPDVLAYGRQDYGNRVGFWRMLDVLDKHDTPCTAVVNADALARYPSIRDAVKERRWRFLGHGMSNTRFIYGHGEAEERAYYEEIRDTVATLTGMPMLGMGGPGPQSATESTPDILAELGFLYHGDWYHDDQPMPLRVRSGRLISVPYAAEVNDAPFLGSAFEAADFLDVIKRQFDQLYYEGSTSGRVLCISIHPTLIGQPQRARYLDEALRYVFSFPRVWKTTGDEIAEYYMQNHYDTALRYLDARKEAQ